VGQKTHPKGFRLVSTQTHLSNWYSQRSIYSSLIEEDFLIREKVQEVFKDLLLISTIEITRTNNTEEDLESIVVVTINALYPRAKETYRKIVAYFTETKELEKRPAILKHLKGNLTKFINFIIHRNIRNLMRFLQIKTNKEFEFNISFIRNRFEDANLTAKFIGDQLEKRLPFRRVIGLVIKKVQLTTIKGIKVEVSGRLNGIDIARSEWKRDGKIPLHTLRAIIDYTHLGVQTVYGVIGIKVWLFVK
jgi:small subunit ribosomal protein S3